MAKGMLVGRHTLAVIGVAASVVVISLLGRSIGILSGLERLTVDQRFALRGSQHAPNVAVVGFDEKSFFRLPRPPLPRSDDATVIRNLHRAGARIIALDLDLSRPSPSPQQDADVVRSLIQSRPAVVSVSAVAPGGITGPLAGRVPFSRTPGVVPGTTFLYPDSDGSIRDFPVGFHGIETLPVLAAELLRRTHIKIPARALIDYPGPAGTVRTLSLLNVLDGTFAPAAVRGRIVVIGYTAEVLQDIHQTPADGGGVMSGPEIIADAAQTAVEGFPLRYASSSLNAGLIIALALLVPLASIGLGPKRLDGLWIIGLGLLGAVVWSLAAQLTFDAGTIIDYTDGLLAVGLSTLGVWALTTVGERRERAYLRARFADFDDALVQSVLNEPSTAPIAPDAIIAGFRLETVIGTGAMGVVYRARQLDLERDVALKLIRDEFARDADYRRRFKRESLNAAAISHQNVIPVFQAGEDASLLYMAMQLVPDLDLAQWISNLGPLEPHLAGRLVLQLGAALDAAHTHEKGLIHRDVKPENILVTVDRPHHVFLTDFGVALDAKTTIDRSEKGAGTADYMAPEQISGDALTLRADIYSLAAVLFHALTGRVPFERDNQAATLWAHLNADRPLASAIQPGLPEQIDHVIVAGMAIDPNGRPGSAGEFAREAAQALGLDLSDI